MKRRTQTNITAFVGGFLLFMVVFLAMKPANATTPKPPPPAPKMTQSQGQAQDQAQRQAQEQGQTQGQQAHSNASVEVGPPEATATSGDVSATVDGSGGQASTGDYISINEHTFYSYRPSDRQASGCFSSGDAAYGNDGKFGAFGLYWLDPNCWMDHLAAQERDVELNATLKCGGRKYRNAMSWDAPKGSTRRDKTRFCIDKVTASGLALIEEERKRMQQRIDTLSEQKDTLLDLRTVEQDQMQRMREEVEAKRLREATEK